MLRFFRIMITALLSILIMLVGALWFSSHGHSYWLVVEEPFVDQSEVSTLAYTELSAENGIVHFSRTTMGSNNPDTVENESRSFPHPSDTVCFWGCDSPIQTRLSFLDQRQQNAGYGEELKESTGGPGTWAYKRHYLVIPAWSLVAILSFPLLLHAGLVIRGRRRRLAHSLCPICSYDRRAHKAGERCPECGTAILTAVSEGWTRAEGNGK